MAARAEIAAALSTVADCQGYEFRPDVPKAGDGWPLLVGFERVDGRRSFLLTQKVVVLLPADERAASAWIDDHVDALFAALEPAGFVDSLLPGEIPIGTGRQYALIISMRGE